jgi:hypothetical protein
VSFLTSSKNLALITFYIITPSYGQIEWLKMCVASVADQVGTLEEGRLKIEDGSLGADENAAQRIHDGPNL